MSSSDRAPQSPKQQLPEDEETAAALQSLRRSRAAASPSAKRRKLAPEPPASTSEPAEAREPTAAKASVSASFPPEFLATRAFVSPRDFFVAPDAHGSADSVVCTLCEAAIGSRTFTLKRHLYRHHPSVFRAAAPAPEPAGAASSSDTSPQTNGERPTVALAGPPTAHSAAEAALVAWLRADDVPVAALTSAHFRTFLQALSPAFALPEVVVHPRPPQEPARTMRGLCLRGDGSAPVLRADLPVPVPAPGEALIRVLRAGICGTDLMMVGNYKPGFAGVLGHEFVGLVEQLGAGAGAAEQRDWLGTRVVGEINIPCDSHACRTCSAAARHPDDARARVARRNHCPSRAAVGIVRKAGVFAEYATLPLANLHVVPECVVDAHAVFAEPLAAACRVVEQQVIRRGDRVAVLGDGKLGLLVAEVLHAQQLGVTETTLIGKHPAKLALMKSVVTRTCTLAQLADGALDGSFDVCVECTGAPGGAAQALRLLKRGGVLVAKSTCAAPCSAVNARLAQAAQARVVGSRCGPIEAALALLRDRKVDVQKFVHAVYPLARAEAALALAGQRGVLKVQLVVT
ncbi:hypothetical protein PybrP1_010973 [[Pythium] brassicae (nom. inval.)]|nr:hypothetical protein PybrP1_010973 [[Pythium] brassicae (nom. inval.)]